MNVTKRHKKDKIFMKNQNGKFEILIIIKNKSKNFEKILYHFTTFHLRTFKKFKFFHMTCHDSQIKTGIS